MSKATEMGITPAYAGKRGGQRALRFLPQDHPRVCGEKPLGLAPAGWPSGITPAYAGKSL